MTKYLPKGVDRNKGAGLLNDRRAIREILLDALDMPLREEMERDNWCIPKYLAFIDDR